MRLLLLFAILLCSVRLSAQHVFYGERPADKNDGALFFDKDGFPYPDYFIADSSMANAYGSLFTWFMQNSGAFIEISASYQLFPEKIDRETIFQLRDSITAGKIRSINRESYGYPAVAFYVHGFRKLYVSKTNEVTSAEEFRLLKANLATYGQPEAFGVEVYWDGMYDCCFSAKHSRNKELFRLFETAAKNAQAVGLGLRTVLSGITNDHLQIISHSLGAQVVASALFNREASTLPTPSQQHIAICMLAPAIDGHTTFKSYHERQTTHNFSTADNYRLMIVYNEDDFVLLKKDPKTGMFGPGTKRYGETSLGCNYRNEAVKLERYFSEHYPNSTIRLLDKTSLGKAHSFRFYASGENLKEASGFLWEL